MLISTLMTMIMVLMLVMIKNTLMIMIMFMAAYWHTNITSWGSQWWSWYNDEHNKTLPIQNFRYFPGDALFHSSLVAPSLTRVPQHRFCLLRIKIMIFFKNHYNWSMPLKFNALSDDDHAFRSTHDNTGLYPVHTPRQTVSQYISL